MHPTSMLLAALLALTAGPAPAGEPAAPALLAVGEFGDNPGQLGMQVYLPAGLPAGAALVVVPHGCFQDVEQVFRHSGWVELADRHGFALLFPTTSKDNEPFGGCFRTWVPGHQARGAGEPLSLANQVRWMLAHHDLDPQRVFMSGQSSGGLVTAVMLASYPELFAAGAIQSAYPYRCADAFEQLAPCSQGQADRSVEEWAALLLSAAPDHAGPRPRVSLWHGMQDALIVPANLERQRQQWARVLGTAAAQPVTDMVDGQQRQRWAGTDGAVVLETVQVAGMDHAIAIDPDGEPACGSPAPYIVDADICAARWIGRWFGVVPEAD